MAVEDEYRHVKRIFATDSSGTVDPDVWVDVLRIDQIPTAFQSNNDTGVVGQIKTSIFHWNDDPNNPLPFIDNTFADIQGENANAARDRVHQLDVLDPNDPNNDDHVRLWLVDRTGYMAQSNEETGVVGQGIYLVFDNTPQSGDPGSGPNKPPADRWVDVIQVYNNDLAGAQMSDDDGSNPRIVDGNDYFNALLAGTVDTSQSLTVEITYQYIHELQSQDGGQVGQQITFALGTNHRIVAPLFDAGDPNAVDANGNSALIRTDPLQTVVNVGYGGLAVEFGDHEGPPKKK